MASLNEILTSAATLISQSEAMEDGAVKDNLRSAARTLLESAQVQLMPGASPAPDPDPVDDDD